MTAPDASRWERFVHWVAPFNRLWLAEKKVSAGLRAEVATLTEERDRARLIATTLSDEQEWTAADAEFLEDGVWPS